MSADGLHGAPPCAVQHHDLPIRRAMSRASDAIRFRFLAFICPIYAGNMCTSDAGLDRSATCRLVLSLLLALAPSAYAQTPDYRNPELPTDQRVDDLIGRLTIA